MSKALSPTAQGGPGSGLEPEQNAAVVMELSADECPTCGGPVKPQRIRRGLRKVYCSRHCQNVAWARAHPRFTAALPAPTIRPQFEPPPRSPAGKKREENARYRAKGRRVEMLITSPAALAALSDFERRLGSAKAAIQAALEITASQMDRSAPC